MGNDRLVRLRLRAGYESRRQVCRQVLDALKVIGQDGDPEVGDIGFEGFVALSGPLRCAAWPPRFRSDTSACFDGSSNPVEFLQCYAINVRVARGDGRVMANWFPMATKGELRRWL
jgi:hypothetical protein